jgi:large subunit ribosomal protein L22
MAYTEKVQLNYLNIAPRKVRLIGNTLKGMSATDAQAQLLLRPQRAAAALAKLLNSAIANAKHNGNVDASALKLVRVTVDSAPVLKRSLPRAQGRATSIFKRMSHVTLILEESAAVKKSRFVVLPAEKKEKAAPSGKEKKAKRIPTRNATKNEQKADIEHSKPEKKLADPKEQVHDAADRKPVNRGAVKRFFNRKAI